MNFVVYWSYFSYLIIPEWYSSILGWPHKGVRKTANERKGAFLCPALFHLSEKQTTKRCSTRRRAESFLETSFLEKSSRLNDNLFCSGSSWWNHARCSNRIPTFAFGHPSLRKMSLLGSFPYSIKIDSWMPLESRSCRLAFFVQTCWQGSPFIFFYCYWLPSPSHSE